MKYEDTGKLIIDKLAGELSPRQAAKLDKHLAACDACRREFAELSKIWQLTGDTLKAESFAGELAPAKRAEIFAAAQNEEKRRRASMFTTRILEYAAVFVICLILAGMLLPALSQSREKARRISAQGIKKQLELEKRIKQMDEEDNQKSDKDAVTQALYAPAPSDLKKSKSGSLRAAGYAASAGMRDESNFQPAKESYSLARPKSGRGGTYGNVIALKPQAPQIQRDEPEQRLEEAAAPVSASKSITTYPVLTTTLEGDSPVQSKPMRLKREITKGDRSYLRLVKEKEPLSQKSFKLNLKLWNMTTASGVMKYLKTHNYPEPNNLRIYKAKNTIVIWATPEKLKKIEKLFQKLQEEEQELNDLSDGLPFIKCSSRPVSTFSIDTDTASYVQARKSITRGERPDPLKIRPEEFINYFDYNYRSPHNTTFAVYPEAASSPFRPENTLFRIAVQGKRIGPDADSHANYTILLDTSGSMAVKDRMELAKKALAMLCSKLNTHNYVSLLLCGERTQTVFRMRPLSQYNRQQFLKILDGVTPRGVADFAQGISEAYTFAGNNYMENASNRVIIISDGIFELNPAGRLSIAAQIEKARKRGISNIVIGLGGDGDDQMLENVAAIGDGSYVFLDAEREAEELFSTQFEARFREIARDVKIQVEFNPDAVKSYRQIGYKNRQLSEADFRNDKVDAGEVGSGQSVTALYELKLKDNIPKDAIVATVRIRYKKVEDMSVEEKAFYLSAADIKDKFAAAGANFKLAAFVSEFAEALRYPETKGIASLRGIADELNPLLAKDYRHSLKVTELLALIRRAR